MKNKITVRSSFKDISAFKSIPELRRGVINQAPAEPIAGNFAVNAIANFLHPSSQSLIISDVIELAKDTRKYILKPNVAKGTAVLAYYRPGQYISITLNIGNSVITRPYNLCSAPSHSLDDEYVLIIRRVPFGFASKYIFENWQKGTEVEASAPTGNFYYQPIRDFKNVIGICDTRGVTSFIAMAEAIAEGASDMNLTLLYACRKKSEAAEAEILNALSAKTEKFNVVYVLSDEKLEKCERGFVTKSTIEKYAPSAHYSVFVSGATSLYNRISPQLSNMNIDSKNIRFGLTGQIVGVESLADYPKELDGHSFLCKVMNGDNTVATIPCSSNESLLVSLERAGIAAASSCRSGECGFCRAKLTKGNVYIPRGIDGRKLADSSYGMIHPCCSYPMSDLTLVIK